MKKLIAILAFAGFLLQTFHQVATVAAFYSDQDFIARNLCENRDNPKMHCEGKCCLKRKLAKEASDQAPTSRNSKSEEVVNLFFAYHVFEPVSAFLLPIRPDYFERDERADGAFERAVFHPPSA